MTPAEMWDAYMALPAGWTAGCRQQDEEWVRSFSRLDFPAHVSNPVDALPAGYDTYLAVMHQLEDADGESRRWTSELDSHPWTQVRTIMDDGLSGWRYAGDIEIGPPQSQIMSLELGLLSAPKLFTCAFFGGAHRACTVTGPALARALDGEEYPPPQLWFPHDRSWVANAPHDAGWTYVACDEDTATRLRGAHALEVLPCTYERKDRPGP